MVPLGRPRVDLGVLSSAPASVPGASSVIASSPAPADTSGADTCSVSSGHIPSSE